ncbi:MAG: T9SS type A sorting domain-containing protein [Bacteroidetes bacterium]|nr:T9SS type A sorting domain-containing protein [Bacteroidota bacterium]
MTAVLLVLPCLSGGDAAIAGVITPTTNFTEHVVASGAFPNPTINVDMVSEYNRVHIKAIVYSSGSQSYLYAEDGYGHSNTLTLPAGSMHPDVAMACWDSTGYGPLVYEPVVTYTIGNQLYVEVYHLTDVGWSTFNITPTPEHSVNLGNNIAQFSHVDMWADNHGIIFMNNFWSLHQFAVVFTTATGDLYGYVNDAAMWNASASVFHITAGTPSVQVTGGMSPDVACQMDNAGNQWMHIAYTTGAPSYNPGNGCYEIPVTGGLGVNRVSYNYSIGNAPAGVYTTFTGQAYIPRIEAFSDYSYCEMSALAPYQIVWSAKFSTGGHDQVWSWNPKLPGPQSYSQQDFTSPYDCMSACVAAGATCSYYTNSIGNVQYTVGFCVDYYKGAPLPAGKQHVYERQISPSTGTFFNTNTYQASTTALNFPWDINRNMAVSNTSNYGQDLISVWYNGSDIVWKESTPDVMAFRMTHNGSAQNEKSALRLVPIPASDDMFVQGIAQGVYVNFEITDWVGRSVARGSTTAGASLNVSGLPRGHYLLRIADADNITTLPFVKE